VNNDNEVLKKLADISDEMGRKLSVSAAGMRDDIAKKMGEEAADLVILNAIIGQLAFVIAGVVSDRKEENLNDTIKKDLDGIRKDLHKATAEVLSARLGQAYFLEILPPE